jgi:hypothetical protein
MPHTRIFTAGASVFLLLAVTLTGAAAQSATTGTAGQPLPLLQFVHHGGKRSEAKSRRHPKLVEKFAKKKTIEHRIANRAFSKPRKAIADAQPAPTPSPTLAQAPVQEQSPAQAHFQSAASAFPQNMWPAADPATPDAMTPAPDPASGSVTTEAVVDTNPNQIVTGGHSVQAALPNGLNGPDAAPNGGNPTPKTTTPQSAAATPVVHAMVVKADTQSVSPPSQVGSASWIAHVLAALGGAIAAGAVAWFLIRPAPERTYG